MDPKWFCRIRNQQSGPHTWAELQDFAARGELTPRSLVRREDERTWMEAKRLQGLFRVAVEGAPPPPPDAASVISDVGADATSSAAAGKTAILSSNTVIARKAEAVSPIYLSPEVTDLPPAPNVPPLPQATAASRKPATTSAPPQQPPTTAKRRPIAKPIPEGEPVAELVAEVPAAEPPPQTGPVTATDEGEPVLPIVIRPKTRGAVPTDAAAKSPAKAPLTKATPSKGGATISGIGKAAHPTMPPSTSTNAARPALAIREERRKAARKKLLLLVGGTTAALALVGGIGWAVSQFGKSNTNNATTAQTEAGVGATSNAGGSADATNEGSTDAVTTAAPDAVAASSVPSETPAAPAAAKPKSDGPREKAIEAIVQTITPWRDASKSSGFSTRSVRLQILGAYFANPEDLRPIVAADDEAAKPEGADEKPAAKPVNDGKRVLCVELRIVCLSTAEVPLSYNSWNLTGSAGHSPTAFLLDSAGRVHELIPHEKWADAARQTAAKRLQPGQSVDDLLVFEAPPRDENEFVRVALKLSAMGQGDRYAGLHFPIDQIAASRPIDVEPQRPARAIGDPVPAGDGIMEDSKPQPAVKAAAPAVPVDSPEDSLKELHKQIDKSMKGQKEARAKEVEELKRKEEMKDKSP